MHKQRLPFSAPCITVTVDWGLGLELPIELHNIHEKHLFDLVDTILHCPSSDSALPNWD